MRSDATCEMLRRLWELHSYSLLSYLFYAPPVWKEEDGACLRLLKLIHEDQRKLADRIGEMVLEYGGKVLRGMYPLHFTAMHDLSSRFLWAEMIDCQEKTVDAIEQLVPQLPHGTIAQSLAQECLGAAKSHLDSMRELSALIGVDEKTLRRWAKDRGMPTCRVGKRVLVLVEDFAAWLRRHRGRPEVDLDAEADATLARLKARQ